MFRTLDGELHGDPGGGRLPWDGPTVTEMASIDLGREPARRKALDEIADLWLSGRQADAADLLRTLRDGRSL